MSRCTQFSIIISDSQTEHSRQRTLSAVPAPLLKDEEGVRINHASPDDTLPILKARRQNDVPGKIIPRTTSRGTTVVFIAVRRVSLIGVLLNGKQSAVNSTDRNFGVSSTRLCRMLLH